MFVSTHRSPAFVFDHLFDAFQEPSASPEKTSFVPRADISENETQFRVELEIAGFAESDVNIQLKDDVLSVSAEKAEEKSEEKDAYFKRERHTGGFKRTFRLPKSVDKENIQASLEHGVLTLALPKREEEQPKEIKISLN